ncbi:hypothetical protein FE784_14920 [Paenibacillus hemerocallicola]|uniref:Uncharacterized protein n=1 Tax=Paenibacillus hemerocallicola TaxID=1172614 RepID=A0A5C4TA82_9BACL|nr:hypothetical protein [Paenibacillus hemerocallicola]TNJ65510.1 hypothetical protein FE784_14920 [Paenibacillus hemerocallicola]
MRAILVDDERLALAQLLTRIRNVWNTLRAVPEIGLVCSYLFIEKELALNRGRSSLKHVDKLFS